MAWIGMTVRGRQVGDLSYFVLMVVICGALSGQSLQKFRTFYSVNDERVPAGLLTSTARKAVASDGVEWAAAARGLYRNSKDYFAGMRYLPDDEVVGLLPDASHGIWVLTSTGVSHIELREMTLAQK